MRIQDHFNLRTSLPVQTTFPAYKEVSEALTDLKRQWHRDLIGHLTSVITRTSEVKLNPNLFLQTFEAITHPSLYNCDFLVSTMSPFPALRPLWKFLIGGNDVRWKREYYEIYILLQLLPIDIVALWLQLKASGKFYRGHQALYQPMIEDYPKRSRGYLLDSKIILPIRDGADRIEMSAMEYLDRCFLGSGGLLADFKRLALPGSTVIQCVGYFEGREVLTPPLGLEAKDYLAQLITGRILPYHYPKILEDYLYADSTQSSLGIGSDSDQVNS